MQKLEILKGGISNSNTLHILNENRLVLNKIFDNVDNWYDYHIKHTNQAFKIINERKTSLFPEPTGININMMPIKYFDLNNSLPKYLWGYLDLIKACPVNLYDYDSKDITKYVYRGNRIVYLTIHESMVPVGKTQRRPGLHIEKPLGVINSGKIHLPSEPYNNNSVYHCLSWGLGSYCSLNGIPVDGIYMANNLSDTCMVYPNLIINPTEFVDKHGGIEHARNYLGKGTKLQSNEICWMTDSTPHESLPITSNEKIEVERSFFRLVVGDISIWYEKHNTPNPLGIQPDCQITAQDKFL